MDAFNDLGKSVVHQQGFLLSCQLGPTFPLIVEGMQLTEP